MNRLKKIAVAFIAGSVALFILLLAAVLIVPKLIDMEMVRKKISSELTKKVGVDIDFERIDLSVFPAPHVNLYEPKVVLPQRLTASAEAINVYPEILPLLSGKINIKELLIQGPDLTITLQKSTEREKTQERPQPIREFVRKAASTVSALPEFHIPDINTHIRDGRIKLIHENKQVLEFHQVEGHLTDVSNRIKFEITSASDIGKSVSVSGWLNTRQMKSSAKILLTHVQPQVIYNAFFPSALLKIQDAPADLTIDLEVNGPAQIQVDIDLSMPQLTLANENETVAIQGKGLKGRVHLNHNSAIFSLSELILDSPRMQLSGHLMSSFEDSQLRLKLEGRDIDVKSTRQAMLALSGKHDVTRNIFEVVKGGAIPLITLEAQGLSLSDLGNIDNLSIRGQMRDGEVHVPGVSLDLVEASGDVVISHGILEGENLQASLGGSLAQNGTLKLGLSGNIKPFHLETEIQADLSELSPILKGIIDDPGFQKELALVTDVKGNARGKLVIGKDTETVKVRVEASDIHLTAGYRGLPFPLQITDGNFTYAENRIGVSHLIAKLGKSSFSQLAAGLDLRKTPYLEITSGKFGLHLSELVPWLTSFEPLRDFRKYDGGGKSMITLSAINLKGPLSSPKKWHFNVSGAAEDLVVKNLPKHPAPVTIASGKFKVDPQTLAFTDAQVTMLDGAVKISGTHKRYLEGVERNGRVTVEGRMGPQFIQWVSNLIRLPPALKLRPLTLSTSSLSWNMNGKTTLSGHLAILDGSTISADIFPGSDELIIKNLFIRDKVSRATIGLHYKDRVFDLSFSGNLHKSTIDRLYQEKEFHAGWINGNFRAHINPRELSDFRLQGKLKGHALSLPLGSRAPLKIDAFSVSGDENSIRIESADLAWRDMRLNITGSVKPLSKKRLWIDMDMTADSIDLGHLIQTLKKDNDNKSQKKAATAVSLPVQGKIRFKTERFTFGDFTWNPLHADIDIKEDTADVTLTEARLCGISTPGTLKVSPKAFQYDINPIVNSQDLNPSLNCFSGKTFKADGKYALKGNFQGRGKVKDLLKTSTGQVELVVENGHIYHDVMIINVIKFLNVTEKLSGHLTEQKMEKKGFGYRSIRIKAVLKDGKIMYEKAVLDGIPMTVTALGEHNLLDGRLRLDLLVAPIKTLDRVLGHVPVVGGILHTLDTIPLSLKGSLRDVKILPLAPSAVAFELKELMENTVDIPVNLVHADKWRGIKSK